QPMILVSAHSCLILGNVAGSREPKWRVALRWVQPSPDHGRIVQDEQQQRRQHRRECQHARRRNGIGSNVMADPTRSGWALLLDFTYPSAFQIRITSAAFQFAEFDANPLSTWCRRHT